MDWTHGNGVTYDPRDNTVIMSLRNQSAMIKVSRKTGEVIWILGQNHGWGADWQDKVLKPVGATQLPYYGHNPRVTPQGTIVLYDNALDQALPFDGGQRKGVHDTLSRGVEYEIDEEAMTVRQLWASVT